ncbi:Uncharacterised protein [Mycobacterium tuberculosis]|nr:Uncharacterised protein [Mycobacterium tuberculosis]
MAPPAMAQARTGFGVEAGWLPSAATLLSDSVMAPSPSGMREYTN